MVKEMACLCMCMQLGLVISARKCWYNLIVIIILEARIIIAEKTLRLRSEL